LIFPAGDSDCKSGHQKLPAKNFGVSCLAQVSELPNAPVQRGGERQWENDKKFASRAPLVRRTLTLFHG